MKQHVMKGWMIGMTFALLVGSCRKKDAPLPDNQVQFESSQQGLAEISADITLTVKLSRAVDQNTAVNVSLVNTGVDYGTDYTTNPAAASGVIALSVLSGSNTASFTVNKASGALFNGDEKIVFRIISSASPVIIGSSNEFTLSFEELVASSSSIVGDGGGVTYGNKIFFDLSANTQTGVQRTKWDLGFYSGADDFRVTINSATFMMVKQIDKNDLNAVTAADTVGFSTDVFFDQMAPGTQTAAYIDSPDGDLTKTAIASIAATAEDNKVYIVNRGKGIGSPAPERGWKKIRVIRNASGGYTLQHADIGATTFTTIDVAKDDAYFFKYISFETGAVDVEPKKDKWDFAWGYFTNITDFGGGAVAYPYQDFILQNRNVSIAKVLTATTTYEAFAEANIAAQTFITTPTAIGADWRAGGGPTTLPAVRTDRFYVIKDGDGNYYKLRFTAMTQNGERGYPAFEYVLVKRGS